MGRGEKTKKIMQKEENEVKKEKEKKVEKQ